MVRIMDNTVRELYEMHECYGMSGCRSDTLNYQIWHFEVVRVFPSMWLTRFRIHSYSYIPILHSIIYSRQVFRRQL